MTIRFLCPMGHPLAVPDNRAGKKGRCPVCQQRVVVPRPPGSGSLSDEEVANLLADPNEDDDDDSDDGGPDFAESDLADSAAAKTDHDAVEASQRASRRKTLPDARRPAKSPPVSSSRAAPPSDSGSRKSPGKSTSPGTQGYLDPPGDHHQWLEGLVGEWDYRTKLWLEPGATPSTSIGSAQVKWMLGQRFVQIESQGTLLDAGFGSLWTLGYDNAKRAYTSCYLDNHSTGHFLAEGQPDSQGDELRLFGTMHGWQAGQHNRAYLYVLRQLHREKWTLELHDVLQGEKIMEIAYSRK